MALPWLAALKIIPWGDVIEHAPAVLKGARRLLDRQSATPTPAPTQAPPDPADLQLRLEALQRQHASDMAQLTQTVAALAEQNTRLVEAVDVLRWRTRWLGAVMAGLLVSAVVLWWR